MAVRYTIDVELALVVVEIEGAISADDLTATSRAIAADPAFDPGMHAVIDARLVGGLIGLADPGLFRGLLSGGVGNPLGLPGARRAVVVSERAMGGLSWALRALRVELPPEYQVFSSVDAARSWLREDALRDDALRNDATPDSS
jgi:hypothetical protein